MKQVVLTSGVAAEYVLGELCEYLRRTGREVHELDFADFTGSADTLLRELAARRPVYITSAHANLSVRVAEQLVPRFAEQYPNYLSPLEIIPRLNPALSIYVSHDLLVPFGGENLNECRYLDLFDYLLAPREDPVLQAVLPPSTKVCEAGWIKYAGSEVPIAAPRSRDAAAPPRVQLFISSILHLQEKFGSEGMAEYLRPLLAPNVRIKLPAWKDMEEVEAALRRIGAAEVVAAHENSAQLILESDVVVCNAVSSIHAEAVYLGRPTICLLDDEAFTVEDQRRRLSHLPEIYFHDYRRRAPIPQAVLDELARRTPPRLLQPFRYELVEEILESSRARCVESPDRRAA